ncbi:MAG TPA: hypothetical protein EYQ61_07970 [Dehalococcoidia bacterium]|jgi:sodium pump decarboxylase gamma subunit|nr:hypothetical protein [Dehalococcoidia bacterium]
MVTLVGMGIVFAVLALLALSIKGMSLLDREKSPATAESTASDSGTGNGSSAGEITSQEVAGIAVAMALSDQKSTSMPSPISRTGSAAGSWLQSGRMRMLGQGSSATRDRRN